ncbi:hypothetical protein [Candidatus Berkiella aquae]|uniref:Uncharacterized protein n=1 Tax=Candidatus Berkiella aquae TaxID=295108 RepID=A0A0Q9YV16_9GAMM|nr:hypothetical protein [Candidatus Berkiella aquae]MCS5711499.1 hypothetical protein [Candidatus Berkiella aquae]
MRKKSTSAYQSATSIANRDYKEGRNCKSMETLENLRFTPTQIALYLKTYEAHPPLSESDKLVKRAYATGMKSTSKHNSQEIYDKYLSSTRTDDEKEAFKQGYLKRKEYQKLQAEKIAANCKDEVEPTPTILSSLYAVKTTPLSSASTSTVHRGPNVSRESSIRHSQSGLATEGDLVKMIVENTNQSLYFLQQYSALNVAFCQQLIENAKKDQRIAELEQQLNKQTRQFSSPTSAFRTFTKP